MNNLGLQNRLLYISLIPALILGVLALGWFTFSEISNQQTAFKERTEAVAKRLADALSLPVSQNDDAYLQALLRRSLDENDARSVRLFDRQGNEWQVSGPNPLGPSYPMSIGETRDVRLYEGEQSYRFLAPIYSLAIPQTQQSELRPNAWVEIEFDYSNTQLQHYQTLLTNISLLAAAMLIIAIIALYLNREITRPVKNMIRTVVDIREGNLDTRIPTKSKGELGELEDGINAMAETIKESYNEMQDSVEQATKDLRETLETIEIQNIELDMARREAQQANQVKTEFLANMSHEIRTPLNGIIGFARLLSRSTLSKKQEDYLGTILSSSQVLLTIINDVLDFTKIEAGKLVLDNRSNNLRETIEDVITMLHPSSASKNLETISLYYSDVPEQLIFDPLRLKQVLTNLISNAIKFTADGSVVVRTMIEQQQGSKVIVRVSVTDTGIGLNKTQQKALFQAFSQADSSTAREFGGTGLGLVISKRLVEQMGGDIGLESEKGRGSTFWFNIKAEVAPAAQQPEKENALVQQTVAIVESRDMSRLAMRHQLEAWGAKILELKSVDSLGLHLQRKGSPTPTMAIVELPSTETSPSIAAKILKIERVFKCPILIISGSLDEQFNSNFIEQGANNFLMRPIRTPELYQALLRIIHPKKDKPVVLSAPKQTYAQSNVKVLAVDDNPANLKLIVALLEAMGANVDSASGGEQAVKQAIRTDYDLIFMDIQMPNMDGLAATRHIRRSEKGSRHVPIVALTAHALADEKDAMMTAGMDDYLSKPIDENLLQKTLIKWTGDTFKEPQANYHERPVKKQESDVEHVFDAKQLNDMPVVDLVVGLEKAAGKLALAKDMFSMLIDSLDKDQNHINTAYQQGDFKALLEHVHRLHGATHYCGVPRLRLAAMNTESLLKQGYYSNLEDALFILNEEMTNLEYWMANNDTDKSFEQAIKVYAIQVKNKNSTINSLIQ